MRGAVGGVAFAAATLGAGALAAAALLPVPRERVLDAYVLAVGAIVLVVLARATSAAGGRRASIFERALARPTSRSLRPPDLVRLEREVALATATAFDAHVRLRPTLRTVAGHRLAARGVDLDRDPARARALLGDELFELVRADRPIPVDRQAAGVPVDRIRGWTAALERI